MVNSYEKRKFHHRHEKMEIEIFEPIIGNPSARTIIICG